MATTILRRMAGSRSAGVVSRGLAALLGGYALAFGATAFLAAHLPLARPDRVITASLLCFAVWVAAAFYAFAARSATRAWLWLIIPAVIFCLGAWLPGDWRMRP
ncbi:DUF3649 domain-containing protein [Halopseudomonas pertucinogena]|uniref:DUF3649 domain-containing protein n=1 Tax=Halopseudomonas pertucinogena TaxID=86175 RepID=A0ABQ2CJV7_9GAMM|nr:DUF3649 domain-containing protein [Halopseudomonas pertucinogena]GGI89193.1 hypothetical protein GCM10009083_01950 [Halopseudomonas pertucinogena]